MARKSLVEVGSSTQDANLTYQHVRTDEGTYEEQPTADYQETAVDAHPWCEEFDGLATVGSVIAAGALWRTNERHPVTRTGERTPIPRHVRAAIWYRDKGRCDECSAGNATDEVLHLDHIKPWSAGGTDTSDNLRMLCESHNVERSNFIDFARPKRPVTWWCHRCHGREREWTYYTDGNVDCPTHGYSLGVVVRCRVARAYARALAEGEDLPTWHERPAMQVFDRVAYCAHCNAPGMTGAVL